MHHTHVAYVLASYFKVCFVLSQSLAWDKQEAKFGDVMSVQKYSLHTRDLACLCSVLHLKNRYFVISLIFSFISDLVGKLVQFEAYWRLDEGVCTTMLQRRDVGQRRWIGLYCPTSRRLKVAMLRCRDTYMQKL